MRSPIYRIYRPAILIAALLLLASMLPVPARAIPPGLYDVKWTGIIDIFLFNTTGNPGMILGNPIGNKLFPGQPIGFENVTVCPADPDGIQRFAGPVTDPATVLAFPFGYSGLTWFTFGFVQTDVFPVLPLTGLIDTDGGTNVGILTETGLLLDGSEDDITSLTVAPPGPPGSVLMLLAHKVDPNMNGRDDDVAPRPGSGYLVSNGNLTARMTFDPFPTNEVLGSGTPLDPACDPAAVPSTCTTRLIQQPTSPCGTQGPNMPNDDCGFVEVTNVIARFVLDVVFTKTGDLPPGTDCSDTDGDGILDFADNCVNAPNGPLASASPGSPYQSDYDEDQIGNVCDCDHDENGTCGFDDFTEFLNHFGEFCPQVTPCEKSDAEIRACRTADQDGNRTVGFSDFTLFLDGFGGAPGPSGIPLGPPIPPPPPSRNCS